MGSQAVALTKITALSKRNNLHKIIKRRFQKKLDSMNQEVTVTDIVVRKEQYEKIIGEFNYKNPYQTNENYLERLKHYIKLLAAIANQYHQSENFNLDETSSLVIKTICKNHITRLLLHEFALYTADKPLSITEFKDLIAEVEQIALGLQENLYLVLSSIPVVNEKNEVTNHVVHVQCGENPKIDIVTKINPSVVDPVYNGTKNVFYSENRKYAASPLLPQTAADGISTNYGKFIPCETAGGAKFNTAIDICLDHAYGEAKKSFMRDISLMRKAKVPEFIPNQIAHIVTSYSIEFSEINQLAKGTVRADPYLYYSKNTAKKPVLLQKRLTQNIAADFRDKYPKMHINQLDDSINIENPPFGAQASLYVYPKYKLDKLDNEIGNKAEKHNKSMIRNMTPNFWKNIPDSAEAKAAKHKTRIASKKLNHFISRTLKLNFIDRLLKRSKYKIQQDSLIKNYLKKIKHASKNEKTFEATLEVLLENFKQHAIEIKNSAKLVYLIELLQIELTRNLTKDWVVLSIT